MTCCIPSNHSKEMADRWRQDSNPQPLGPNNNLSDNSKEAYNSMHTTPQCWPEKELLQRLRQLRHCRHLNANIVPTFKQWHYSAVVWTLLQCCCLNAAEVWMLQKLTAFKPWQCRCLNRALPSFAYNSTLSDLNC